jgi:type IV secretory pathway VirB2 component (pilin)
MKHQSSPIPLSSSVVGLIWASASAAHAQVADPSGSGPILSALTWIQNTLMGTVATTAAVIAIAAVGFMMLTGRIDWRRGLTVILGAFIIFGAAAIVAGIRAAATGSPS